MSQSIDKRLAVVETQAERVDGAVDAIHEVRRQFATLNGSLPTLAREVVTLRKEFNHHCQEAVTLRESVANLRGRHVALWAVAGSLGTLLFGSGLAYAFGLIGKVG